MNYIKYFFLLCLIVFFLLNILFIILNINPNLSFNFLKNLAFIDTIYKKDSSNLSVNEIAKLFSLLTLILYIISIPIEFALKKMFRFKKNTPLKTKFFLFFKIISLIYLFDVLIILFNYNLDKSFLITFIALYVMNLIYAIFYFLLIFLINKIPPLDWSIANILEKNQFIFKTIN